MRASDVSLADRLAVQVATLGPVGRIGFAPGTWGSATALLLSPWLFLPLSLPPLLILPWSSPWAPGPRAGPRTCWS